MNILPVYLSVVIPQATIYIPREEVPDYMKEEDQKNQEIILLIAKRPITLPEMSSEDFRNLGVKGRIIDTEPRGGMIVRLEKRVRFEEIYINEDSTIHVDVEVLPENYDMEPEEEAVKLKTIKAHIAELSRKYKTEGSLEQFMGRWKSLADVLAGISMIIPLKADDIYHLLELDSYRERCLRIEEILYTAIEMTEVYTETQLERQAENNRNTRINALRQQIEFLQQKLDEMDPDNVSDAAKFEQKIRESGMNDTARKEAEKVLNRLRNEGKNGHEYGMLYDYLDFVTSLKWKKARAKKADLVKAEAILDEDHFGLSKVKDRIIQELAVMNLKKKQSGSILLFVGAPGTGKTSICQSIAKALGREYARVSLGGVKDESDIRGHRRTYLGAMPGRIMDGIHKSGSSNPVVVLDEVDKLSKSFNGDPASALLEVLDPEQNHTFQDHYMNVPYDLSDVMFICTANALDSIPEPLLNRMEVIKFPGYAMTDKVEIAKRHLLPRAMKDMGITEENLVLSDEILRTIISDFTMEAGVRGLRKRLNYLCRAAAVTIVKGEDQSITLTEDNLRKYLDAKPIRHGKIKEVHKPGIVTGLAWTQAGGDILFMEAAFTPGKGNMTITGQLGQVMTESVKIAVSIVKELLPEQASIFSEKDLHVHVPAGAVKKDGPSAGITLVTCLASLVTGKIVAPEFGMTGEVSLRGDVMPIGGLPEKLMAALRAGVTTVFIPEDNIDDLEDVAEEVKERLEILPVRNIEEVLKRTGIM